MRYFKRIIDPWNLTDGSEYICVLRLVVNRLVEETSKLPTVVAQSIPVGIN